jgi:hypothetical protein
MRLRYLLPVLFIAAFTVLTIYVSGENRPDSFETNKKTIILRKIGHEILLNAKDSHSRVLPIKEISDQEFQISFENPVSLMPDSVVNIVNRVVKDYHLPEYAVTITDCLKKETVYGFTISSSGNDSNIVPCLGRELPKDCYNINILLAARQKEDFKNLYYATAAIVVAASIFFWLRFRSKRKPEPGTASPENDEKKNTVRLGKYMFYAEQQYLELNGEKTVLTNKEARLLSLLATAPNTVIERNLLQKEVWGNEGVIVTRSLDMFISKLRKKLTGDMNIKIVNVHGKGYKLEII